MSHHVVDTALRTHAPLPFEVGRGQSLRMNLRRDLIMGSNVKHTSACGIRRVAQIGSCIYLSFLYCSEVSGRHCDVITAQASLIGLRGH
jgi:hypothetical protein